MPLMVTVTCDECDAYAEASAGIDDGVNIIETETEGWTFEDGAALCPEHAGSRD